MTDVALFHSVLGVRRGVLDAAERLRAEGHDVTVVDQYEGRVFDDYGEADEFARSIGYPALMGLAEEAVRSQGPVTSAIGADVTGVTGVL